MIKHSIYNHATTKLKIHDDLTKMAGPILDHKHNFKRKESPHPLSKNQKKVSKTVDRVNYSISTLEQWKENVNTNVDTTRNKSE
ncbi:hypothetical protein CEXT_634301 [Caerostris extrusa]|uniref:Uncharacterized protein n=1 Tax=Caerostris extrusa TaxID=172846 RepID=A0AAV4NCN3_CAEEX|nr:hypothetical protein CEXT_634301 [Caerostris extrusa]